jgi:hypothetical protein
LWIAVAGFLPRRDLKRSAPDKVRPFGENAAISPVMSGAEDFPRGQRVLDGLSGARPGGRILQLTDSKTVWSEIGKWPNMVMRPQVM